MPIPAPLLERIETFSRNLDSYLDPAYKETQLRREFLDPLFEALGWDVDNKKGRAEAYKDVVHEDSLKLSGVGASAPDYSFRIGGTRKFFVEAKKPSVKIKDDPGPAAQLRRYSYSAKLPLGIVTDFHEFAIYDTRHRPRENDKASAGRIFYCTFDQYPEKWDEIAAIFSPEAILQGAFDKYAATNKGKRGTSEFDDDFLEDMERWRDILARNLALRNSLGQRDLNFAVQRILDRIVFLRIAEDRGIEPYGQLQALTAGPKIYPRLCGIFERADFRYNSGLFHFATDKGRDESPDKLTLDLALDDAALAEIIDSLYWPKSPYAFAVIPADILGHIYEQFLGKVIHLTSDHRARVEEKPEVRKAGGVYYTPTYIVRYIVEQTVGPLVAGKSPKQVEKLRVLDPACGSGSFLLGAYEYLLDWHLSYYLDHDPAAWAKKKNPPIYETAPNAHGLGRGSGNWLLTTAERKRILVNNLYGVDIDAQAVEVTKLSLLLKVLEGEARELRGKQLDFHRVLPDLGNNIKCGNSLIGSDFYAQPDLPALDDEARLKINAFDWPHEFKAIMDAGGFDAVIGNPPYVRQESLREQKEYFESIYESFDGVADLFVYFLEKNLRLLKGGGLSGVIVSSSVLRSRYAEGLRNVIRKNAAVRKLVDFGGLAVFENAKDTYVCIPIIEKGAENDSISVCRVSTLQFPNLDKYVRANSYNVPSARFTPEAWSLKSDAETSTFEKISKLGVPLGKYVGGKIFYGIKTGLNEAFVITKAQRDELVRQDQKSAELIKPLLGGENIRQWRIEPDDAWLIFTRRGVDIRKYPVIKGHLDNFRADLTPKRTSSDKRGRKPGRYEWYEIQDDVAYFDAFDRPKIIFPDICKSPRFYLDTEGYYLANTAYCIGNDDRYLIAILNSRLFWFSISHISIPFGVRAGQFRYRLIYQYMEKVPIRPINPSKRADKLKHDTLVSHVERMLKLHADLAAAKSPATQTHLEREIAATDRAIDQLVYQLYELTPEEIALVEQATAPAAKPASDEDAPNPAAAASPKAAAPAPVAYTQSEADAAHHYFIKEPKPSAN